MLASQHETKTLHFYFFCAVLSLKKKKNLILKIWFLKSNFSFESLVCIISVIVNFKIQCVAKRWKPEV